MRERLTLPAPIALLLAAAIAAPAPAQAPSTDVYLVRFEASEGLYRMGLPLNVTDRDGYDNQPQFLADGTLVYASQREGQTDIQRYDPASGTRSRLTATPESEYSPTPIPGREAISVVRDYGEGVQQLWAFPLPDDAGQAGPPERLLTHDLGPIGYHAWVDGKSLLLFVLGEPMTLQLAEVGAKKGKHLADDPGRGLAAMPDGRRMSFVHKPSDEEWWVCAIDPASGEIERLVPTRPGREDYAWGPDGSLWMGDGSALWVWRPGEADWRPVRDLAASGVHGITRLAFSPDGRWLALVAERPAAAADPTDGP